MPKFTVLWTKLYHKSGSIEVEAKDIDAAVNEVCDYISDYAANSSNDIEPTMDDVNCVIEEEFDD